MSYIAIIIIVILVFTTFKLIEGQTFYWKTIIKYLWKQIYKLAYLMSVEISAGQNETIFIDRYKKAMNLRGNIINSILDFINNEKKEEDEDCEEETFGYGRFDFESILSQAKNNPDYFKKL